jgi:hypothetical protein
MRGNEQAFVSPVDWLGPSPDPLDRSEALATLARRYLAGHGPASAQDLAKWAGITLRDARAGLAAIEHRVVVSSDGLLALADREGMAPIPPPQLLGSFDPILHGWVSRIEVAGPHTDVVTTNGLFRPFAMAQGRAVATWGLERGKVEIRPLEPITGSVQHALEQDAAAVRAYLGLSD